MIATLQPASSQYLLLDGISWQGYEQMLRELDGRHFRLTYDMGVLEIMTTSYEHESYSELLRVYPGSYAAFFMGFGA